MPPSLKSNNVQSTASSVAATSAAKNAVIFSLVEQVIPGKDARTAKRRLGVTSDAIALYDKHVGALGHAACMETVKKFLGTQLDVGTSVCGEPMSSKQGLKSSAPNVQGVGVHGDHEYFMQKPNRKRKGKKNKKNMKNKQANMSQIQPMTKDAVINKLGKSVYETMIKFYKTEFFYGDPKERFYKFESPDNNMLQTQSGPKFNSLGWMQKIQHLLNMTPEAIRSNFHLEGYDAAVQMHVGAGHIFFEPEGYNAMDTDEKLAERRKEAHWTTGDNDKKKYQALKLEMKNANMIHKHKKHENWDKLSADEKLQFLMKTDNWEARIKYSEDSTVHKYMQDGRVFFKPPNKGYAVEYRTLNQQQRLNAHQDVHNWTSPNVKESYEERKKAHALNKTRMAKEDWNTMTPDEKMDHMTKESSVYESKLPKM